MCFAYMAIIPFQLTLGLFNRPSLMDNQVQRRHQTDTIGAGLAMHEDGIFHRLKQLLNTAQGFLARFLARINTKIDIGNAILFTSGLGQ